MAGDGTAGEPVLLGWPPEGPTLRLDHRRFSYAGKFVMSNTGKAIVPSAGGTSSGDRARGLFDDGVSGKDDPGLPGGDDAGLPGGDDAGLPGGDDAGYHGGVDDTDRDRSDDVLAVVSFNEDRTDPETLWIRYVSVREDHRGEGLAPRLCRFVVERASERDYARVRIAVNNPFAYEALYRAGFSYTGAETGLAELVLERPTVGPVERSTERYQAGLDRYREHDRDRDRDLSAEEWAFLARNQDAGPPDLLLRSERGDRSEGSTRNDSS